MSFNIKQFDDERVIVHLAGRIDVMTSHILRSNFELVARHGIKQIIVNLARVSFIDSSGLSALVAGLRLMRHEGGTLVLAQPNQMVDTTLRMTNFHRFFGIFKDVQAAESALDWVKLPES